MDKIWDRKSFEVGGHWPLWRGWKTEWPCRADKSRTLKKNSDYKIMSLVLIQVVSKQKYLHAKRYSF